MESLINVTVIIFPDGTVIFVGDPNHNKLSTICDNWKKLHPEYENNGTGPATFVDIKLLRKDYENIPATNESYDLCKDLPTKN